MLVNKEALQFFKNTRQQFEFTIDVHRGSDRMLAALLTHAFSSYESVAQLLDEEYPEPDCRKGCATCCTMKVVATAPEILLVARYVRAMDAHFKSQGLDLKQRLAAADDLTRDCSEQVRASMRRRCPYAHKGTCVIYSVRPLACRSRLSYNRKACAEAAAGRLEESPHSEEHAQLRNLVQNAMQSALRDADYPWGVYELNHALSIALSNEKTEQAWLAGEDVFRAALIKEMNIEEMAATFDRINGQPCV